MMDRHHNKKKKNNNHDSGIRWAAAVAVAPKRRASTAALMLALLVVAGYAAYPLIGTAQAATPDKSTLTINAFSLPDGGTAGVLVEVRSGDSLVKSGFAPLTVEGQAGAIFTVKVSGSRSYAFDHWQDGSKSSTKAVLLSKDPATLEAFFEKITMPPNLTVNAVTANGEKLHMWTTIRSGIQTVSSGLTPLTFSGSPGRTYQLTVGNQEAESSAATDKGNGSLSGTAPISIIFNHWKDDKDDRSATRDVTLHDNGTPLNLVGVYNKGDRVTLQDLGVLQLMSHDLYNTIRDGPHPGNIEDERLNLSTVLDHGENQIIVGGEPRNSDNIALHTVAVKLGKMYLDLIIDKKMSPQDARGQTVQTYLQMATKAYQDTFHEPFPDPAPSEHEVKPDGSDNLTGDLSLRAIHSYVPGRIMVNGVDTMVLDPSLREKTLSDEDMQQLSKPLDGTFDPVLRNVTIFLPPPNPPPNTFTIDLFEKDSSFAKQFGTDVSFEEFMNELKDGRFDTNEKVMFYLREDVANGLMPPEEEGAEDGEGDDAGGTPADETAAVNATVTSSTVATAVAASANGTANAATASVPVAAAPAATLASNAETGTTQGKATTVKTTEDDGGERQLPSTTDDDGGDDEQGQVAGDDGSGRSSSSNNDEDSGERDNTGGDDGRRHGGSNDDGGNDGERDSGTRHHSQGDDGGSNWDARGNNKGDDDDADDSNGRRNRDNGDEDNGNRHDHSSRSIDDDAIHRFERFLHQENASLQDSKDSELMTARI